MNQNHYCIIMAGGVGSRFWPLSRTDRPKQFIDILGVGKTLIQQTFERFAGLIPKENIYIVSNLEYKELILEQLPDIDEQQVLLEPMRKNTAPCIAYAAYRIQNINPNAVMVVAPSDHLILKTGDFIDIIKKGLEFTAQSDSLLTLGIKPHRPETGYGYIQVNNDVTFPDDENLRKVKTFTEKPNIELAKVFYESGEFYWNSGIFIWSLNSIIEAFENHLPEVNTLFERGQGFYNTEKEMAFIEDTYAECRSISIDYGVMEKAGNVYVYCSDFGWSDLGTWGSLYEHLDKDQSMNAIKGKDVFTYGTKNCLIDIPDQKLAVIQGLDNYIVVESDGTLLICKKEDEQQIKQFVNDVKLAKGEGYS